MLNETFTPLSAAESKELEHLMLTKSRIMSTGTPYAPGEEDKEDNNDDDAHQAAELKSAPLQHGPASSKSLSHVTLSGCEIGITLGAVQQLARLFWPVGNNVELQP